MKCTELVNIATKTQLGKDIADFLLNYLSVGKKADEDFPQTRLVEKSADLFATIPLSRKKAKSCHISVEYNLAKETVTFLRKIDLARLRNFDIRYLLESELAPKSFFLTKDGHPTKQNL